MIIPVYRGRSLPLFYASEFFVPYTEHTHIVDPEKLKKLMAILAIAVLWSLRIGQWKYGDHKELPLYSHWRPAKSLFRRGLDVIRRVLNNQSLKTKSCSLIELILILSPT